MLSADDVSAFDGTALDVVHTGVINAFGAGDAAAIAAKLTSYWATTGITLSSPESMLALSDVMTPIGNFPPIVVTDILLP